MQQKETMEHAAIHAQGQGSGRLFLGILIGALIGSGAALLAAPRSGQETRRFLADKGIQIRDSAMEAVDTTREKAGEAVENVRSRAGDLAGSVRGRFAAASQRGDSHEQLYRENKIMEDDNTKTYDL